MAQHSIALHFYFQLSPFLQKCICLSHSTTTADENTILKIKQNYQQKCPEMYNTQTLQPCSEWDMSHKGKQGYKGSQEKKKSQQYPMEDTGGGSRQSVRFGSASFLHHCIPRTPKALNKSYSFEWNKFKRMSEKGNKIKA